MIDNYKAVFWAVIVAFSLPSLAFSQDVLTPQEYSIPEDAIKLGPFLRRGGKGIYYQYQVKDNETPKPSVIAWEYFVAGKKEKIEFYYKGQKHGVWKTWHENGNLKSESIYNLGVPDGIFKEWSLDGELVGQYVMKNGKGVAMVFHPNGLVKLEKHYTNYPREGFAYALYSSGAIKFLKWEPKDSSIGVTFGFHKNGHLKHLITYNLSNPSYSRGDLLGVAVNYEPDDTISGLKYFVNGLNVSEKQYKEALAKDPMLPRVLTNPENYRDLYTKKVKAVIQSYKERPPVKIPLEFDEDGKPRLKN